MIKRYMPEYEFFDFVETPDGEYMLAREVLPELDRLRDELLKAKDNAPEAHKIAIREKDRLIMEMSQQAARLCENCKHSEVPFFEFPCERCTHNDGDNDNWEAKDD